MNSGKIDGPPGLNAPITDAVPSKELEKAGLTSKNQTVVKTDAQKNIPQNSVYRSGVPLKSRGVAVVKVVDSPIATFVAWVSRRPKPSEIVQARALAENLAASIGDDAVDPKIEFKDRRTTQQRGTPEHKACLLLVESGLATIEATATQTITFKLTRSHDLPRQQRLAEFLCKTVPLELASNGTLNWDEIFKVMEPEQSNNLQISHVVVYVGSGNYQVNLESPRALAHFRQLQSKKPDSSASQQYWQTRLDQLRSIALREHEDSLIQCKRAVGRAQNDPPYILQKTAESFRKDHEYAIAAELDMAYEAFCSNESDRPRQVESHQVEAFEESSVDKESWDYVKPVLREAGLIGQVVDLPSMSHLVEVYQNRLPFSFVDLAHSAMLWEKERELRGYYETLDLSKGSELTAEKLQKRTERLDEIDFDLTADVFNDESEYQVPKADRPGEYQRAYNAVKAVYDELKATTPRPSIEQMASKLLRLEPIPRFRYTEKHWQAAHRMLTKGY